MLDATISVLIALCVAAALAVGGLSGLRGLRQLIAVVAELDGMDRPHASASARSVTLRQSAPMDGSRHRSGACA